MKEQNTFWDKFFWILAILGMMLGLVGIYDRMIHGHLHANYGSYVPWGLWVAGYIYLIGLSAGAFLMSALVYVFRVESLKKIGKLSLLTALATLIGALLTIWLDLGHMGRAWRLILATNFKSVMGWMAWLYSAYFILLVIELWFAMRTDLIQNQSAPGLKGFLCRLLSFRSREVSEKSIQRDANVLRILGSIGVPLAVAFHGSVGAIFGVVGARPYWHSGLTPIVFLVGALLSGGALLAFITAVWGPDKGSESHRKIVFTIGKLTLGLLLFDLLLEWAEYSIGLWNAVPSESASLKLILFGPYWWVFWLVHFGLGIVIPLLLLSLKPKSITAISVAGFLIAFTFISVRLNIVIPGLAVPELEGLKHAFTGPGLQFHYFPSVMEWFIFFFCVSVAALIFLLGKTYLPVINFGEMSINSHDTEPQEKEN
jgi:molybdopterin-containing oxidoreductase family membrane subunit